MRIYLAIDTDVPNEHPNFTIQRIGQALHYLLNAESVAATTAEENVPHLIPRKASEEYKPLPNEENWYCIASMNIATETPENEDDSCLYEDGLEGL